ncbi:MAG: hypothetical protein Q7V88_12945, partial [Actinomycetota bacterium]|nr:hypothetical protein [Actinomycetota bacterium]
PDHDSTGHIEINPCEPELEMGPQGSVDEHRRELLMLVYSVELMDDPELVEVSSRRVHPRLDLMYEVQQSGMGDSPQFVAEFAVVDRAFPEDWKLTMTMSGKALPLTDSPECLVQSRPQTMNALANHHAPTRGVADGYGINFDDVLSEVRVVFAGDDVAVLLQEGSSHFVEDACVFLGASHLCDGPLNSHPVASRS